MTPIDVSSPHASPPTGLAAHGDERILPLGVERRRTRFAVSLGLVLAVHALALAWFLHRDATAPDLVAQATEVPIEVVQEPPPPSPKPSPPPDAKPPSLDEKPAASAPRAPPKQAVDTAMRDAETEAPKAAAPPSEGQPVQAPAPVPSVPAVAARAASDGKLEDDKSDAEALDKAKADEAKPSEAARALAGTTEVPTYRFAATSKMSDFPPGTEDNRYLSVVYAKVMSKNRYRASAAARRGLRGIVTVSFVVDFMGRVPYQAVSESSGHPDLDALAMAAVRTAAPYPPPPGSGSQQLVARMQFGPEP